MFDRQAPNNNLQPIPVDRLETAATLKRAITASRSLATLKAAGPLIPNQVVLLRAILLQEAKASSEIENVVTTNDALYRGLQAATEETDPSTREVLRYGNALWHGYENIKKNQPVSPSLAVTLAQTIKGAQIDIRSTDGCQIINDRTGETVYTPPTGKGRILKMLDELFEFMATNKNIDPLIAMSAAHHQFEAIHPFPDGNGRTGRVLNLLFLVQSDLLDLPILYLSGYIVQNKSTYYDLLCKVTEDDDWESWICFMLDAVDVTAKQTLSMLTRVHEAVQISIKTVRKSMPKSYSRELIDVIFSQPYTRISHLEEAGIAKRNTASRYLYQLEDIGILQSIKFGREVLFFNRSLMDALTLRKTADYEGQ